MGLDVFLNGIGHLFGKIPLQGRKERWKNEINKLKLEREDLLHGECTGKKADRMLVIIRRIDYLTGLLENSSDAN